MNPPKILTLEQLFMCVAVAQLKTGDRSALTNQTRTMMAMTLDQLPNNVLLKVLDQLHGFEVVEKQKSGPDTIYMVSEAGAKVIAMTAGYMDMARMAIRINLHL